MEVLLPPLIFISVSTIIALVASLALGVLSSNIAVVSLVIGAAAAFYTYHKLRGRFSWPVFSMYDSVICLVFVLFCARHFLWIYFYKEGGMYTLNAHNFGDLPLHITYIQNIVNGVHFWPEDPIFTGERLHYPFGIDLFTALFAKLGFQLESALPLIGLGCALLFLLALFYWAGSFGVAGFLFSGGLAGYTFIKTGVIKDYQAELAWKNLALTLLIPQRGFLFAFPAGLALIWSWRGKFIENRGSMPWFLEAILWGFMPIFHLHTFIFLSLILAIWVIASKKYREGMRLVLVALLPATVQVLFLTDFFRKASMIWLSKGWMIGDQNPLVFLATNFGFFIPLIIATGFYIRKERNLAWMFFPGLIFFVILFFVMFAPWEWDNTKIMVWCYFLMLPAVAETIKALIKPALRMTVYILMFFSGAVCAYSSYHEVNQGHRLVDLKEADEVCFALRNIPQESRIATVQTFNHPVALCGHQLVAGYSGHLWGHGIEAQDVENKLKSLMQGSDTWKQLAHELNARYIFWGFRERNEYPSSKVPWEAEKTKVVEGDWGKIYDLGENP